MNPFDRLHPAVQYHIVNSLGWPRLRPTQLEAIAPILDGKDCLLLAPTAGGKTEAAVLPLLSRMLAEPWSGLSVLYVCPIKALLNNLEPRLTHDLGLVGRRCGLWHGDLGAAARRRLVNDPPDLLLITPESIEGALTSRDPERQGLFQGVRVILIDELHAFAGDDRGWHLLALTERLRRLAGRPLQRIGLSATVGNPRELLGWLTLGQGGRVIGAGGSAAPAAVTIDYVGSAANAALVIARLHRGEKRLVFCDSRGRVEALAGALRQAGVQVFVSHSSLALDERRLAERAFQEAQDCVIVATSTLELGIDVGDLDRVIQIDAPGTVSSFMQRMGRTGRRPGTARNCLFLATTDEGLLCAAGLTTLWHQGQVEAVRPPRHPYQVVAQQLLAMVLQARGASADALGEVIQTAFRDLGGQVVAQVLDHLVAQDILWEDAGVLWFGRQGERALGRRNFLELLSVFTAPLEMQVRYGPTDIGTVDPLSLRSDPDRGSDPGRDTGRPLVLQLGGRAWRVTSIDWARRIAQVEPAAGAGRSHWTGSPRALGFALCQAVRRTLAGVDPEVEVSRRAAARLTELRDQYPFCTEAASALVTDDEGRRRWWTFAGFRANAVLVQRLGRAGVATQGFDNFSIGLGSIGSGRAAAAGLPTGLFSREGADDAPAWEPWMERTDLKFALCLPEPLLKQAVVARLTDPTGARQVLAEPVREVHVRGTDQDSG